MHLLRIYHISEWPEIDMINIADKIAPFLADVGDTEVVEELGN